MYELFSESSLFEYLRLPTVIFSDNSKDIHIPMTSTTIAAGVNYTYPFHIDSRNFKLSWEFETKSYDILFGIARFNPSEPSKSLSYLSPMKPYSPNEMHSESVVIEEPGDYELIWDNSHSWIREKNINYKLDVIKMEMTSSEKVEYNKRLYEALLTHKHDQETLNQKIAESQQEYSIVSGQYNEKSKEVNSVENAIGEIDKRMIEVEDVIHSIQEEASNLHSSITELQIDSPFLLEGERIFSFLTGVDLLKLCCVNRLLHSSVYQDGIWKRAFYQEDPEQLTPVLQNEHLRVLYQLVNPEPPSATPDTSDVVEPPKETPTDLLKDLSLLYKITEKQGWYKNTKDECYFLRFHDSSKKQYDVIYSAIPSSELDSLIRQTLKSTVLIPMPGTEAGKSGFYIDRFRRVSKWSVESVETENGPTLKWQEIQL